MLNQYACVFNEQASILIEVLRPHANTGRSFDIGPFLVNASIDMITGRIYKKIIMHSAVYKE